ncbi:hypothetical protein PCE1_004999 [Barthelona sp. PCE]
MSTVLKQSNSKKHKTSRSFVGLGLSNEVLLSIQKRRYVQPTPIQRESIPIIMNGSDVLAMSKTGSGKTLAFLAPILSKLRKHSDTGPRAIILAPTRELAIQLMKNAKSYGSNTDLRCALILGGESLERQFELITALPDIIIATPGRLMHLLVEIPNTDFSLRHVEFVALDEGDLMMERGFAHQIEDIFKRIPKHGRQVMLFSATMPSSLATLCRKLLKDPETITLAQESVIPDTLDMHFLYCTDANRLAVLLFLCLEYYPQDEQAMIFCCSKHHCDLLSEVLSGHGVLTTTLYGDTTMQLRRSKLRSFTRGEVRFLITTDLSARGIDIPELKNVVNYDFPVSNKVFVHRVGRTARAGESGTAITIMTQPDVPFFLDLFPIIDRMCPPLQRPSQSRLDKFSASLRSMLDGDMARTFNNAKNAYKAFYQTRGKASIQAQGQARHLLKPGYLSFDVHEIFGGKKEIRGDLAKYESDVSMFNLTMEREERMAFNEITSDLDRQKRTSNSLKKNVEMSKKKQFLDTSKFKSEFFMDYKTENTKKGNFNTEQGEVTPFDVEHEDKEKQRIVWDKKKNRYRKLNKNESIDQNLKNQAGMVRNDSGIWVKKSLRSKNIYDKWKSTKKNQGSEEFAQKNKLKLSEYDERLNKKGRWYDNQLSSSNKGEKLKGRQVRNADVVAKERRLKQKKKQPFIKPGQEQVVSTALLKKMATRKGRVKVLGVGNFHNKDKKGRKGGRKKRR